MANVATYSLGCTRHCISHGPLRNRQSVRSPSAAPETGRAARSTCLMAVSAMAWNFWSEKPRLLPSNFWGPLDFPPNPAVESVAWLGYAAKGAINKSWQANKNGINWTCICIFRMDAKFGVNNHQPLSTIQAGNTRHLDRWFCKKKPKPQESTNQYQGPIISMRTQQTWILTNHVLGKIEGPLRYAI